MKLLKKKILFETKLFFLGENKNQIQLLNDLLFLIQHVFET